MTNQIFVGIGKTVRSRCISMALFLVMIWGASPGSAEAQMPPTYMEPGLQLTCTARHQFNGQPVPVAGINGHAGGFWGFATYNAAGWPIMIFDVSQLRQHPIFVARFIYYHECAHLAEETRNEVEANWKGLIAMRAAGHISANEEASLGQITRSLGPLGPQYGGSGQALWAATMACAGPR